jgi:stage II sporulation protein D
MNAAQNAVNIRDWTLDAGTEPTVRIGVILDEDAFDTVQLALPTEPYAATFDNRAEAPALEPGAALEVSHAGDKLAVQVADQPVQQLASLRLFRAEFTDRSTPALAEPGSGILVRDVIAGRGFHWQKKLDQTLAGTVELLPGPHGIVLVNELPLEDYLAGVITAEMSGACPADLLKAQCVVARSWLLAMSEHKHENEPFDRCNDDCCQRYQGTGDLSETAIAAARDTRGLVLLDPAGNVLDANYAKSCGGISELPRHVWGHDKPGLSAVVDAPKRKLEHRFLPITESNLDDYLDGRWIGFTKMYCSPKVVPPEEIGRYLGRVDEVDDYFRWTVRYRRDELEQLLREKLAEAHDLARLRDLRVTARGVSGRASALELQWENAAGKPINARLDNEYRIRQVLHRKFLYSSAFAIRMEHDLSGALISVTLRGAGWGHGVGMCQIGALGMALQGIDYETICRHYYPESTLAGVYG